MSDGKRYTQQHLDKDIVELDDVSYGWIRKRVLHLYDNGLIERVGTSQMYVISDYGLAALDLRDELEDSQLSPIETGERIREHAADRREEH